MVKRMAQMLLKDCLLTSYNFWVRTIRPVQVILYITAGCNARCRFCELGSPQGPERKPKEELTLDELKGLAEEMRGWGVRKLCITGGEPLLRTDLWDFLSCCFSKGIQITGLTTNGLSLESLGKKEMETLARAVDSLIVSLDSTDPGQHDHFRGVQGAFERTIKGIEHLQKGKDRIDIQLSTVVLNANHHEIPRLISLAAEHKICRLNFQPLNPASNFPGISPLQGKRSYFAFSPEGLAGLEASIDEGIRVGDRKGIHSNLRMFKAWVSHYFSPAGEEGYFFDRVVKKYVCVRPFTYAHVNQEGDLFPCSLLPKAGNIRERGLRESWQGKLVGVRVRLKKGLYDGLCRSCFCDFPPNLKYSLLFHPFKNRVTCARVIPYYGRRLLSRR